MMPDDRQVNKHGRTGINIVQTTVLTGRNWRRRPLNNRYLRQVCAGEKTNKLSTRLKESRLVWKTDAYHRHVNEGSGAESRVCRPYDIAGHETRGTLIPHQTAEEKLLGK